jgi:hypothetical protein
MPINVKIQTFRGTLASLSALATTGFPGVLAWTTDSNELFVDLGSGNPGIGPGNAWQPVNGRHNVFNVATPAALTALVAYLGDFAVSASDGKTYVLTSFPSSTLANWTPIATMETGTGVDVTPLGAPTAHEWVTYIDASGVQHLAQPAFTDISGLLAQTQLPVTIGAGASLTNIDCGTF